MKKRTQADVIMAHLKKRNRITPMDAFSLYGITKLATRVSEMRRAGAPIIDEWETSKTGARYKVYRLHPVKKKGA